MKKVNKLLLSFLPLVAVAPMAMSGKCNNKSIVETTEDDPKKNVLANDAFANKTKEFKNDGKIVMGVTWTKDKSQWNALQGVMDVYNEKMKDKPGFMPISLTGLGSGYSAGADKIFKEIGSANESSTFINLTANYAPTASKLAKEGMLLNFNDEDPEIAVDLNAFAEEFSIVNESTENIVKKGSWILPAMKSTNALGINASVFGYVLEKMKEKGAQVDPAFQQEFDKLVNLSKNDRESVVKKWGELVEEAKLAELKLSEYKIDNSIFNEMNKLLDFSIKTQKMFKKSSIQNSAVHVFGVDDPVGFFQTIAFSTINADYDEYFSKVIQTKNGNKVVDFSGFKSTDSKISKNMSRIYDKIKEAISVGALKLMPGGDYTSNYQKRHEFAFGIGSTAGFFHSFTDSTSANDVYIYSKGEITKDFEFTVNIFKSFKKEVKIKDGSKHNRVHVDGGKHKNPIFLSTDGYDKAPKYQYISKSAETDTKLNELMNNAEFVSKRILLIPTGDASSLKILRDDFKEAFIELGEVENDKETKYIAFAGQKKGAVNEEVFTPSDKDLLNKNELVAKSIPGKFVAENKKFVSYSQGPSFIGIHANDEEDKATKMFMKWLLTPTKHKFAEKYEYNKTTKKVEKVGEVEETAVQHISRIASYIFPIKGFENESFVTDNDYLKVAHETFSKSIKDGENFAIFEELAGENSDKFRSTLNSVLQNINDKIYTGTQVGDYVAEIVSGVTGQIEI